MVSLSNHGRRILGATIFVIGMLWALPNTMIGLLIGLPALPFGARLRIGDGALVFVRYPCGPGGALTLGNVIVCTQDSLDGRCRSYAERHGLCPPTATTMRLGDHERAHVLQTMALGLFFLPTYLLCGGISPHNRFEQAADRYALTARGWWPWPRPGTVSR